MKRIVILLLSILMVLAFVSCGGSSDTPSTECTAHNDANGDGKCDTCGTTMNIPDDPCVAHVDANGDGKCDKCGATVEAESSVSLIEDGTANFQFVLGNELGSDARIKINSLVNAFKKLGITVTSVNDLANNVKDCEVLIGDVKTRGEDYTFDKYSLGKKGYIIKAVDNKVIINAGQLSTLSEAIDIFISDVLGYDADETNEITNVTFSSSDNIIEVQDDYLITSFTIGGISLKGKTLAIDVKNSVASKSARDLQDALYTYTGNYLPIVSLENASASSIVIKEVPDDGEWGFKAYTENGVLTIECGFRNRLEKAVTSFINEEIVSVTGNIDLANGFTHNQCVRIVTYEEFGAKGDGKTDDYFAINRAHEFANECGEVVVAKEGATYYIKNIVTDEGGGFADTVSIKTNVIWTGATFIIDDQGFLQTDRNNSTIFFIHSDYETIIYDTRDDNETNKTNSEAIEAIVPGKTLDKDTTTKVNWTYGYPALLVLENINQRHFIRKGNYDQSGGAQREIILIDAEGNIDPSTPFNFDFEDVTRIEIIRADVNPITIKDGTFITKANDMPYREDVDSSAYISRGISVKRCNTTVDGLVHIVEDEEERYIDGLKRHAYSGFLSAGSANNVLLTNCTLQGRRYSGAAGTYDFQAGSCANLTLYNVNQSNFYDENGDPTMDYYEFWGIGGTNYCKNLTYDSCTLSRFDAHEGLHNGKIINCTISNVEIIGFGDMIIENTTFKTRKLPPIMLRSDYGCTWRGTITVKDCTVDMTVKSDGGKNALISSGWSNHYNGYITYFPNIVVDNLEWIGVNENYYYVTSFNPLQIITGDTVNGEANVNPYTPPEYIKVLNAGNYTYVIPYNDFFSKTKLEGAKFDN